MPFLSINLYYHNLIVRFYPEEDVRANGWMGAMFRNNFLHAAREVENTRGETLYDILSRLPLASSHPYYKQLCGGFPKGFVWDVCMLPLTGNNAIVLERGHVYTVTIRLIGRMAEYAMPCCMAVNRFFEQGIGHPRTPLHVMDICETDGVGGKMLYNDSAGYLSEHLELPCFMEQETMGPDCRVVTLRTLTPVCLMKTRKAVTNLGYQEKLNGFPSFYQWTRSAAYRLYYLDMLYGQDAQVMELPVLDAGMDEYLRQTYEACLLKADLRYRKLYGTPKKEKDGLVYGMDGYEGMLTFRGVSADYLPLLRFMSCLGVGNDINYGLGLYEVRENTTV